MAFSSSTLPPSRSISLPSRVHPTSLKLEAVLDHLKSCQISSASAETLQHGLVGLAEMYNCLQDFIQSSQSRRDLLQYQNGKLVEEALNDSVTILDTCDAARCPGYHEGAHAIKKLESKFHSCWSTTLDASDQDLSNVARVLREASSITISVLRSILLFLSMPGGKTRAGRFSLISKLTPLRSLSSEKGQNIVNEVGSVDLGLCSVLGHFKTSDPKVELQTVQRMLESLDVRIEGLETGLDCIFKCLVQNRVTLLNIITN